MTDYIINEDQLKAVTNFHDWGDEYEAHLKALDEIPFSPLSEEYLKEWFHKEIGKWKDEDPLLMAYVHGQEAERKKFSDELKKERERTMDEFGILHGEDAKRFHEEMNNLDPMSDRAREIIIQAIDLIDSDRKAHNAQVAKKEGERVLDVVFKQIKKDSTLPNGTKVCIGSGEGLIRHIIESLRGDE